MITEDFVSFNVAKLLKEKGFDEPCRVFYKDPQAGLYEFKNAPKAYKDKLFEPCFLAPSLYMAMKWLREVHKLAFIISPQWAEGDMRNPCRWYWEIRGLENIGLDVYSNPLCNTYEEAVEAACIYSLKNLICV